MLADRRTWFLLIVATGSIAWSHAGQTWPQALPLSVAEFARQKEEQHFHSVNREPIMAGKVIPGLPAPPSGRPPTVVTGVTYLGSPGTSGPPPKHVMVTRYEYTTGLSWQTVIDLGSGSVVSFDADRGRPTPLADIEIKWAIKIARSAIPALSASPPNAMTRLIHQPGEGSPFHGHRLVAVWADARGSTDRVLVDLTTEQIVRKY